MKTSSLCTLSLLAVLTALVLASPATAASITNAQSGNFGDTTTWQGGVVPTAGDNVYFWNGGSSRIVTWGANSAVATFEMGGTSSTNIFNLAGYTNTLSGFFNDGIVSGAASMLTILSSGVTASEGLKIGTSGGGADTLILSNGAIFSTSVAFTMGASTRDFNKLTIQEGSKLVDTSAGPSVVGNGGSFNNTVLVQGALTNTAMTVGAGSGTVGGSSSNKVVVSGANARWDNTGNLILGADGYASAMNSVVVSNGGTARVGGYLWLGRGNLNTNDQVVVSGSNSTLTIAGGSSRLDGVGSLLLATNGATLNILSGINVYYTSGGSNTVMVTGTGSVINLAGSIINLGNGSIYSALYVRDGGTLRSAVLNGSASGHLKVENGGVLEFTTTPNITLGGGDFTVTDSTIAIRGSSFYMDRGLQTALTYSGANTLRMEGATNVFDAAPGVYFVTNGARYSTLEMRGSNSLWKDSGLFVGAGAKLSVTNATGAAVNGVVTNAGTISVIGSTVNFKQAVVSSGGIVTDPSTVTYEQNLTLTPNGYINATNDTFVFYKNFINQSTNQPNFNLAQATVRFVSNGLTTAHTYDVTGSGSLNIGQGYTNFSQVAGNFAIGALSIQAGNRLTITGTVGVITNAVYVGWLDIQGLGSGSLLTNNYSQVTNTLVLALNLPNISLFYDKYDGRNDWLTANLTGSSAGGYNLWGGGLLLPIPEPSAMVLVLGGAVFGAWLARRRAARG